MLDEGPAPVAEFGSTMSALNQQGHSSGSTLSSSSLEFSRSSSDRDIDASEQSPEDRFGSSDNVEEQDTGDADALGDPSEPIGFLQMKNTKNFHHDEFDSGSVLGVLNRDLQQLKEEESNYLVKMYQYRLKGY